MNLFKSHAENTSFETYVLEIVSKLFELFDPKNKTLYPFITKYVIALNQKDTVFEQWVENSSALVLCTCFFKIDHQFFVNALSTKFSEPDALYDILQAYPNHSKIFQVICESKEISWDNSEFISCMKSLDEEIDTSLFLNYLMDFRNAHNFPICWPLIKIYVNTLEPTPCTLR